MSTDEPQLDYAPGEEESLTRARARRNRRVLLLVFIGPIVLCFLYAFGVFIGDLLRGEPVGRFWPLLPWTVAFATIWIGLHIGVRRARREFDHSAREGSTEDP